MMEFHAEIEMQEQKPSLLGLCLARRKKAKPIDTTQIFHGFVLYFARCTLASPKLGCISEIKINADLFCISLDLN